MNLCIIIFLISLAPSIYGQKWASGKVLDTNLNPIPDVTIVSLDLNGRELNRTSSDKDGKWNIRLIGEKSKLQFRCLSYKTQIFNIENNSSQVNISIILENDHILLDEVTISVSRIPFYTKGDTTIFSPSFFRTKQDRELGDLFTHIDQFEIRDGKIYYLGNIISDLTIENANIFSNNTNSFLSNISVESVEKISVIENKNDNGEINFDLNVTLKNDYKNKLMGKIDLASNFNNHDFIANPYKVGKTISFRYSLDLLKNSFANKLNLKKYEDLETIFEKFKNEKNLNNFSNYNFQQFQLGTQNNELLSNSLQVDYKLNKNLNINLYGAFGRLNNAGLSNVYNVDLIQGDTIDYFQEYLSSERNISVVSQLEFRKDKNSIVVKIPLDISSFRFYTESSNLFSADKNIVSNKFKSMELLPRFNGVFNLKNGYRLWIRGNYLSLNNNNFISNFLDTADNSLNYLNFKQEIINKLRQSSANVNLVKSINQYKVGITSDFLNQRVNYELIDTSNNLLLQTIKLNSFIGSVFVSRDYKKSTVKGELKYPFLMKRRFNQNVTSNITPIIELNYRFEKSKGTFAFLGLSNRMEWFGLFQNDTVGFYKNFNNYQESNIYDQFYNRGYTIKAGFGGVLGKSITFGNINYSVANHSPVLVSGIENSFIFSDWKLANKFQTFNLQYVYTTRFNDFNIKFSYNYLNNKYHLENEGNQNNSMVSGSAKFSTFFKQNINFDLGFSPLYFISNNAFRKNEFASASIEAGIKFSVSQFFFKTNMSWSISKNSYINNRNNLINFQTGFNFYKNKLQVFLKGYNVFGLQKQMVNDIQFYQTNLEIISYSRVPGYFQIGISFLR